MPDEPKKLALPDSIQPLFEALQRDDIDMLNRAGARLGGGTVLAARWGDHRRSTDLDFFMPLTSFKTHEPGLTALANGLVTRLPDAARKPRHPGLPLLQLESSLGDIDLVGMADLTPGRRDWRNSDEWVAQGTLGPLRTLTTPAILHGKLDNRIFQHLARDRYDVAFAARCHPDELAAAFERSSNQTLGAYVHQVETGTPVSKDPHKPILDPAWASWETDAPPFIVRAIDDFYHRLTHRAPDKTPPR